MFRAPITFSVSKTEGYPNEDSFAPSPRKGVLALSDGASVSFDSATWSKILSRHYARNPRFTKGWLSEAIASFNSKWDREQLPWMQQAAFDKGSFASLFGVELDDRRLLRFFAIGDSVGLICEHDEIVVSFPYERSEDFGGDPQLLCTNPGENAFLDGCDPTFEEFTLTRHLEAFRRPSVLCMTDALGHWTLKEMEDGRSPISTLRTLTTKVRFQRFVDQERRSGRLRRDDTTLLALWDLF